MVSPVGVAPSRIVCVSASVNLPLHHKVHKFSSGTGSPGWSRKKGRKTVVVVWWYLVCEFKESFMSLLLLDNWCCSLKTLDRQLHRCVYDRKYSLLPCVGRDFCAAVSSVQHCGHLAPVSSHCGLYCNLVSQ